MKILVILLLFAMLLFHCVDEISLTFFESGITVLIFKRKDQTHHPPENNNINTNRCEYIFFGNHMIHIETNPSITDYELILFGILIEYLLEQTP